MDKPRALSSVPAVLSPSKHRGLKRGAAHTFPEVNIVEHGSSSPDVDQDVKRQEQEGRRVIRTRRPRPRRQINLNKETPSQRGHSNSERDLQSDFIIDNQSIPVNRSNISSIPTQHQDPRDNLRQILENVRLDDDTGYMSQG